MHLWFGGRRGGTYRAGNSVAGMEQSQAAKILDRQRADTIEAISHSAEWSASVAMMLQQLVDTSIQQDLIDGKVITGINTGGVLISTGEVLVMLGAINDLLHPPWSPSSDERQSRAQARGYHLSRLVLGSEEEFKIPWQYGLCSNISYKVAYELLHNLVNSSYWENREVSSGTGPTKQSKNASRRKKKVLKKSAVATATKPPTVVKVALAQVGGCADAPERLVDVGGRKPQPMGHVHSGQVGRLGKLKCWFCRKPGHRKSVCFLRKRKCYACGMRGHIAHNCFEVGNNLKPVTSIDVEDGCKREKRVSVGLVSLQADCDMLLSHADVAVCSSQNSLLDRDGLSGCHRGTVDVGGVPSEPCDSVSSFDSWPDFSSWSEPEAIEDRIRIYDDIPLDDSFLETAHTDYLPFAYQLSDTSEEFSNVSNLSEGIEEEETSRQVKSILDWSFREERNSGDIFDVEEMDRSAEGGSFLDKVLARAGNSVVSNRLNKDKRIPVVNFWKYHMGW